MQINILAQQDGDGWGNLLYLLVFIVVPMLNSLGAKLRKKFGKQEGADQEPRSKAPAQPVPKPTRGAVPVARPSRVPPGHAPAPPPPVPQARPTRQGPPLAVPVASSTARTAEPRRRRRPKRAAAAPLHDPAAGAESWHVGPSEEQRRAAAKKQSETKDKGVAIGESSQLVLPKIVSAGDLRAVVILGEILRPPLALREFDQ